MKTLTNNYKKNIEILKENLKRGMEDKQAIGVINSFERQFIANNLYGEMEQEFIRQMRQIVVDGMEDKTSIKVTIM